MKICYLFLLVLFLLVYYYWIDVQKDGFKNDNDKNDNKYKYKWSDDLIRRFNIYQTTMNQNVNQYNLEILQNQASPEEAEELIKTGLWPWKEELKNLYVSKILENPIIKIPPKYALNYAMKTYNQNAVTELLAWNSKEGDFLLYGGDLGVTNDYGKHNTIKCGVDINGNSIMQKQVYKGDDIWNGQLTNVKNEDIPKEMSGFSFVKNVCNPCESLNYPSNYDCPFKINLKGDDSISKPWAMLWGLN
jgi:hypothetical protein